MFAFAGHGGCAEDESDFIMANDGGKIMVISDIVNVFLGHTGSVMHIPKLFFFDSCRGTEWLTAAPDRAAEEDVVNFRIDYATIPEHKAPSKDKWMRQVAKTLRENDVSLGDAIAIVKKNIYEELKTYPQQPDTRDRLVTGPLMLYYKS